MGMVRGKKNGYKIYPHQEERWRDGSALGCKIGVPGLNPTAAQPTANTVSP